MKIEVELILPPEFVNDYSYQKNLAAKELKLNIEEISAVQVIRRSVDARSKNPIYRAKAIVYLNEELVDIYSPINFKPVVGNKKICYFTLKRYARGFPCRVKRGKK